MNDVGRNEFEALVQKTKRISLGSPTYPVSVGIKWAEAELKRLREENGALLEGMKCVADFASIPPRASGGGTKEEFDRLISDIALDLLRRVQYRIRRAETSPPSRGPEK